MTDVQPELLESAAARHPRLAGRLERSDIFDARDVAALGARGPFSIVAALGAVLNHARDHRELARGFGHLVTLAAPGALLIVDVMLSEMFAGHPRSIWADILHVLPGFDDLARLTRSSGLQVLEAYSLYHRYPPTPTFGADFDERMLRLFLLRAGRTPDAPAVRSSRRARPDSRRRAPNPSRDSSGARRATRRRRRA